MDNRITREDTRIFFKVSQMFWCLGSKTGLNEFIDDFPVEKYQLRDKYEYLLRHALSLSCLPYQKIKIPITSYGGRTLFMDIQEFEKFLPEYYVFLRWIYLVRTGKANKFPKSKGGFKKYLSKPRVPKKL